MGTRTPEGTPGHDSIVFVDSMKNAIRSNVPRKPSWARHLNDEETRCARRIVARLDNLQSMGYIDYDQGNEQCFIEPGSNYFSLVFPGFKLASELLWDEMYVENLALMGDRSPLRVTDAQLLKERYIIDDSDRITSILYHAFDVNIIRSPPSGRHEDEQFRAMNIITEKLGRPIISKSGINRIKSKLKIFDTITFLGSEDKKNVLNAIHHFTINNLGVSMDVKNSSSVELEVSFKPIGTIVFSDVIHFLILKLSTQDRISLSLRFFLESKIATLKLVSVRGLSTPRITTSGIPSTPQITSYEGTPSIGRTQPSAPPLEEALKRRFASIEGLIDNPRAQKHR